MSFLFFKNILNIVDVQKNRNYVEANLRNNNVDLECVASFSFEKLDSRYQENYISSKLSLDSSTGRVLLYPPV